MKEWIELDLGGWGGGGGGGAKRGYNMPWSWSGHDCPAEVECIVTEGA